MRVQKYIVIVVSVYLYSYADATDASIVMSEASHVQQDVLEKGKKKVGKEVHVSHNKSLVTYNTLGSANLPRMNDFVVVPLSYTDTHGASQVKMIWGRVIGRNHYVFVVQISKNKGLYYTEYNMYALV